MSMNYHAKIIEKFETKPGCWQSLRVGVFDGETQIGEYVRNYSSLYNTFYPFKIGEQWYALYSKDYTATSLMTLPDCKHIGGEERSAGGFCPTGYYVPKFRKYEPENKEFWHEMRIYDNENYSEENPKQWSEEFYEPFAFISGCVWGDDSSWKIQLIDLKKAAEGIITRKDIFGYVELPEKQSESLKDCVKIDFDGSDEAPYWMLDLAIRARFSLKEKDNEITRSR